MKGQIARGAAWIAGARVSINLIGFASTLLLAKLLVPQDFGLIAIATTVIAIVAAMTEVSLYAALVQRRTVESDHYHTAFTLGLLRGLLVAAVTASLAWPVAHFYGDARLTALICVLACGPVITGASNPRLVDLTRSLQFHQEFLIGVSSKLAGFLVSAAVAAIYKSYWAIPLGALVTQTTQVTIGYLIIPFRPRFSIEKVHDILSFSIWLTLSGSISTINFRCDTLLIGHFLGQKMLGYYSYGDNLANMATREAVSPIAQTLFPAFARLDKDLDRLRYAYSKVQNILFAVALPVGAGMALFAQDFILLVLGEKWRGAIIVIQVIAASSGVVSLGSTCVPLALALGRTKTLFFRELTSFSFRIPVITTGLLMYGFRGLVFARIVSGLFVLTINMHLIRSLIKVKLRSQLALNIRPMIAAGMMCAAVIFLRTALGSAQYLDSRLAKLVLESSFAGTVYVTVLCTVWNIQGRPEGIESEVFSFLKRAWIRLGTSKV